MNKEEFTIRAKRQFTDKDYAKIETVYASHPSISPTDGKDQIAYLFNTFGMRIIENMLPTAREASELEDELTRARIKLEMLQDRYRDLLEGKIE